MSGVQLRMAGDGMTVAATRRVYGAAPARVVDVLETDGGWHTIQMLHAELQVRFGAVAVRTVARAVDRLVADGLVEHRIAVRWRVNTPAASPFEVVEVRR